MFLNVYFVRNTKRNNLFHFVQNYVANWHFKPTGSERDYPNIDNEEAAIAYLKVGEEHLSPHISAKKCTFHGWWV